MAANHVAHSFARPPSKSVSKSKLNEHFGHFDSKYISSENRSKTIWRTKGGVFKTFRTAYGTQPIRCDQKSNGIHTFRLKIIKMKESSVTIGIDQGRDSEGCDFSLAANKSVHYAVTAWGSALDPSGQYTMNGVQFKTGDTVTMQVDVGNKTLSVAIGGGKLKRIFKIRSSIIPYYLAVVLQCKGDKMMLLDYSYIRDDFGRNISGSNEMKQVTSFLIVVLLETFLC